MLSELCGEDLDVGPRRFSGPVHDPRAHPFDTRCPALQVALDDAEALAIEVISAGSGHAWSPTRRIPREAVAERGPAFVDAARDLLGADGARWWGEDVSRVRQVVLGAPDVMPDLAARAADQYRMLGAAFHGRIPQAPATSRSLGSRLPAVGLLDPGASLLGRDGSVGCWAVTMAPDARVYEVTVEVAGVEGVLEDVDTEVTAWFRPRLGEPELIATVDPADLP